MVFPNYNMIVLYWNILDKSFNKASLIELMRVESLVLSTVFERLSIPPLK
jgi:hypothetical protein